MYGSRCWGRVIKYCPIWVMYSWGTKLNSGMSACLESEPAKGDFQTFSIVSGLFWHSGMASGRQKSSLKYVWGMRSSPREDLCCNDYGLWLHRGLGVWFKTLGLKILFGQKWFGGLLGTPLEGIPPRNPQGALSGGRYSFQKSAWRWNKGWKGAKNQSIFFALKISNMCPELMKNWRAWKIEFIHAQKLTKICF